MGDLKTVSDLLRPWDFKCKLDLRDAYFTIDPTKCQVSKFTRFQFRGRTCQFTCLPFGLTYAPCTFTKVHKTNYRHAKENGCPDNS